MNEQEIQYYQEFINDRGRLIHKEELTFKEYKLKLERVLVNE